MSEAIQGVIDDNFINADQPWPGLASFPESAHDFFHGREQATADLVRLVSTSHAAVLFGQSGLGKTSLIQAGLFPQLRCDDYLPIYVRLDHDENAPTLSEQILATLEQECRRTKVDCPQRQSNDTLWAYFHRLNAEFWGDGIQLLTPVLVLDQFEELFTVGRQSDLCQARAASFIDDLAGLVENRPPKLIRQQIEADPASGRSYDFARASFRLMVSLREDFLPDLEGLMPQLPTLRLNRMRLLPMNGIEALQVVEESGRHLVENQVGEHIVRFVAADKQARPLVDLAVEPSLLSLICRELNFRRQAQNLSHITSDLLTGARDEILGNFYDRCLEDLPPAVGEFIEEHLLSESGYRNSFALEDALRLPEITRQDIDTLVLRRLLRLEERSGILRVELTHDVLTQVARERRTQRREAQAQTEARRQVERNRQRARRLALLAAFMLLLVIAMAGLSWNMFQARHEAESERIATARALEKAVAAQKEADQQRVRAEERSLAAQRAEQEALAQKTSAELALKRANIAETRKASAEEKLSVLEKKLGDLEGKQINKGAPSSEGISAETARKFNEPATKAQFDRIRSKLSDSKTKYQVRDEVVREYPEIVELVFDSNSMTQKEKQYWFDILPSMSGDQISRLYGILETEKIQSVAWLEDFRQQYMKSSLDEQKETVITMLGALRGKGENFDNIYNYLINKDNVVSESELLEVYDILMQGIAEDQEEKRHEARKRLQSVQGGQKEKEQKRLELWQPQFDKAISSYNKKTKEGYLEAARFAEKSLSAFSDLGPDNQSINLARTYELIARAYGQFYDDVGLFEKSLVNRNQAISIYAKLLGKEKTAEQLASALGAQSYSNLFARRFTEALDAANSALLLAPDQNWIKTNQAHALLFLGRVDEAKKIYKSNWNNKLNDKKTFGDAVLEDFEELRKAGLPNENMQLIESLSR